MASCRSAGWVAVGIVLVLSSGCETKPGKAAEALVRQQLDAIVKGDYRTVWENRSADVRGRLATLLDNAKIPQVREAHKKYYTGAKVTGSQVMDDGSVEVYHTGGPRGGSRPGYAVVVKEGGQWKIYGGL